MSESPGIRFFNNPKRNMFVHVSHCGLNKVLSLIKFGKEKNYEFIELMDKKNVLLGLYCTNAMWRDYAETYESTSNRIGVATLPRI